MRSISIVQNDGRGRFGGRRDDIFITTKHWRKYHGYDESLKCLKMSLKALRVERIDLGEEQGRPLVYFRGGYGKFSPGA